MPANEQYLHRLILFIILPLLLVYAIVFASARLYGDSAGYLYTLIQTQNFFFAHARPASIFIEWLPLLLIKCNAPLSVVIYGLSIAEWVYIATCYIVFSKVLKVPRYGIGTIVCYLFGSRWNYYNPVSELILAFPFVFFLAWYWQRPNGKLWLWLIISLVISTFLVYSHPLYAVIIPALFVYIHGNKLFTARNIAFGLGLGFICISLYLRLDSYEKSLINNTDTQQSFQLNKATELLSKKDTLIGLARSYAGLGILLLFVTLYLLKQRRYYHLGGLLAFCAGYTIYVWLKYYEYYPYKFEPLERYIFIIAIAIAIAAVQVFGYLKRWQCSVLVIALAYHLFTLAYYGWFVQQRYLLIGDAIANSQQFKENKVAYRVENYVYDMALYPGHSWTMFYETMFMTALNNKYQTRQVFLSDVASNEFIQHAAPETYYADYGERVDNISKLNPNYFVMAPTAWRYANTDSMQMGLDTLIPQIGISSQPIKGLCKDEYYVVKVKLANATGRPIYSGIRQQRRGITYRWKNSQTGELVKGIEYISPLMCDLYTTVEQQMVIFGPPVAGNYKLELGYATELPAAFTPFKQAIQTITIADKKQDKSKLIVPIP